MIKINTVLKEKLEGSLYVNGAIFVRGREIWLAPFDNVLVAKENKGYDTTLKEVRVYNVQAAIEDKANDTLISQMLKTDLSMYPSMILPDPLEYTFEIDGKSGRMLTTNGANNKSEFSLGCFDITATKTNFKSCGVQGARYAENQRTGKSVW